jgi:hypothetical protein
VVTALVGVGKKAASRERKAGAGNSISGQSRGELGLYWWEYRSAAGKKKGNSEERCVQHPGWTQVTPQRATAGRHM